MDQQTRSFLKRLGVLIAMLIILFGVVFGITTMDNNDMFPRMSAGDLLLYYRLESQFQNQDIIVFQKDDEKYVGRIVAMEGDTVEVTERGEFMVNESVVIENDIYYSTPKYEEGIEFPITLEKNEFFVLCDYREGAKDSRYFGPVRLEEIKGNVITLIRRSRL